MVMKKFAGLLFIYVLAQSKQASKVNGINTAKYIVAMEIGMFEFLPINLLFLLIYKKIYLHKILQ